MSGCLRLIALCSLALNPSSLGLPIALISSTAPVAVSTATKQLRVTAPARPMRSALKCKISGVHCQCSMVNPESARTIVVGDVHGCRKELEDLLEEAKFDSSTDQLIFVGDLVAKGPESIGCVKIAADYKAITTMGNHEAKVLREGRNSTNSTSEHLHLYQELCQFPALLAEYLIVHAGILPGTKPEENSPADLFHMRNVIDDKTKGSFLASASAAKGEAWAKRWTGPEFVVFGHDAKRRLQLESHAIGLDTGCVYGGRLSALVLPERRLVSVPAREQYAPIVDKN